MGEKHQYYSFTDLVKETRQPAPYLKEILHEFCKYNLKNPHKNMWELKPEYRHYKSDEAAEGGSAEDDEKMSDSDKTPWKVTTKIQFCHPNYSSALSCFYYLCTSQI